MGHALEMKQGLLLKDSPESLVQFYCNIGDVHYDALFFDLDEYRQHEEKFMGKF
jgi:hypothetical protein